MQLQSRLTIFYAVFTAQWVYSFFRNLGAFGLFLLGALDSSFLFLSFGNDLLLIALISANRRSAMWIVYVLMSTAGSLAGVFLVDLVMRRLGEKGLEKFAKPNKIKRLKARLQKNTGWTIFLAAILPPPFPFTVVVMAAAALQSARRKLFAAVLCGRLLRFTVEALLALRYGSRLLQFMNSKVIPNCMMD
jgi:membrane protein YqaA with SNARE-associated domain